jgi:MoaA/NifB/PqqE/SkfB family radical SAM enzyme
VNHNGSPLKARAGPCGLHLFDRTSGTNILLEELCLPKSSWARAPRYVSIALTNSCDLACSYCYAPKHPARLRPENVLRWLAELDLHGCLGVGFGGGEPTIYRDFVRLCRYANHNTHLAITFTTHAHHLNDELLRSLDGSIHFVRVSMDGVGATYERMRSRSFSTFLARLTALRSISPFGINYVVNSLTMSDLPVALDIAAKVGATELLLLPEHAVRGKGGIDDDTTRALGRFVHCYEGPVRLSVSESGSEGLPVCDPLSSEDGLRAFVHIDADGVMKRSSYASDGVLITPQGLLAALGELQAPSKEA